MEKNLKPFDLAAAKAGAPVVTVDGYPVRILCFDMKNPSGFELVGLVTTDRGNEQAFTWNRDGRIGCFMSDYAKDLRMVPVKRTGWVNLYRNGDDAMTGEKVHEMEEDAINAGIDQDTYIATVPVEWEE